MNDRSFIPPVAATVAARRVSIPIDLIDVPERIRAVSPAQVDYFAAAIGESGFKGAITLRPSPKADGRYDLVAGAHRLAAMVQLGRADIPVDIVDMTDAEARLWEIEENLVRHELNAPDRMAFLLEAKRLRQAIDPSSRRGGDRRTKVRTSDFGPFPLSFTDEMVEKIGVKRSTILADIACAEALGPELLRLFAASQFANNRQALIVVSQMPAPQRSGAVQDMIAGRYKTAAAARDAYAGNEPPVANPDMDNLAALHAAWGRSSALTRQSFLDDIGAAFTSSAAEQAAPAKPRRGIAKGGRS